MRQKTTSRITVNFLRCRPIRTDFHETSSQDAALSAT